MFFVVAVSCLISIFALLLDTYHSYLKSKRPPPRWITFVVFSVTPPVMVAALG